MSSPFSPDDLSDIEKRGADPDKLERQLQILRQPPRPIRLSRPCLSGSGVKKLDHDAERLEALFRESSDSFAQLVPASGAATRMFSFLPTPLGSGTLDWETLRRRADDGEGDASMTLHLLDNLGLLPFASELESVTSQHSGQSPEQLADQDPGLVLELIAGESGLGLAGRPKGLLPFHRDSSSYRTAFEEHLWAAAGYLANRSNVARIHFTVAAGHEESFRAAARESTRLINETLGIDYSIDFSLQEPATDTIACDLRGTPARTTAGQLLFRPGGHGSLLVNLARIAGQGSGLVFLKNIDNIAPAGRQHRLARWKRLLAGHLIDLRQQSFELLHRLESEAVEKKLVTEVQEFLVREFAIERLDLEAVSDPLDAAASLRNRLDRPLRVCGVVANRGEPGGGPFWVRRTGGTVDGQIVEGAQVDQDDPDQQRIWSSSTHFNPVDIVCSLHDREGTPYDLERFVDPSTYFVTTKEVGDRTIRVLERPGLWNGSMADWNTAFVEVPEETFSPVKTLCDLLRPDHQAE